MSDGELQRYYDDKHRAYVAEGAADNAHARIPALIGSGREVLDVGCGSGQLGAAIRAAGSRVTGLELSAVAAAGARARLDDVWIGDVADPELELPEAAFDVVVCADVLEHVFDPAAVLARLRATLRPSGRLVASIPNVGHWTVRLDLLCGRWEYRRIGILDEGHVRFFTRASSRRLLEAAGFAIETLEVALSIPEAAPLVRRLIDLTALLPRTTLVDHSDLLAAQLIWVGRRT